MTAVADFEQRWRQRGKTLDRSFKVMYYVMSLDAAFLLLSEVKQA